MLDDKKSILKKDISPIKQALFVLGMLIIFNVLAFIINIIGINSGPLVAWEISLSLTLFFAIANAVFFLNAVDKNKYWTHSIFSFAGLVAASIGIATLISGIGINEAGSLKWIYFVFSFGYLVFISIIGLMRRIVEIAIKQDKKLRGEQ